MRVGISQRPKAGERICGDGVAIVGDESRLLVMLCDGTGHGPDAAAATARAARYVRHHAGLPLSDILVGCGRVLHGTRGGAVALLRLDAEQATISFASVGNVELRAVSQHPVAPICSPGILGRPIRRIHSFSYPLTAGDRLLLFSDGITRRVELQAFQGLSVQAAAERILEQHAVAHDDATCVVVEFAPHEQDRAASAGIGAPVTIQVGRGDDVVRCGAEAARLAMQLGFAAEDQQHCAAIARELAAHLHQHAPSGLVRLRHIGPPWLGLEVMADEGCHGCSAPSANTCDDSGDVRLANARAARAEQSFQALLDAIEPIADEVAVQSRSSAGRRVVARKLLDRPALAGVESDEVGLSHSVSGRVGAGGGERS